MKLSKHIDVHRQTVASCTLRWCIILQGKRILGACERWSKNEREKKLVQHVVQHFLLSFCWTKRIWSIDGRTTACMFMLPMFRCCLHLGLEVETAWEPGEKVTQNTLKRDWKISLSRWLLVYLSIDNTLYTGSQSLKMYVMVLLLFFIYLVPVVFVFCIVLKLGLWLAINLIQLAVWLLKHAFVLLWKLLVFVAVLVFASLRSSPPPK